MNRQQRRAMEREQRSKVTADFVERERLKEARAAIRFQNRMFLAAAVLALHREFGFGLKRCLKAIHAMQEIAFNATCAEELCHQAAAETGIDVPDETEDLP